MPALVKASPAVLTGGFALVRYSITQDSGLTLSVEAEFVGLPSASLDAFRLGTHPPAALQSSAGFLSTLATYGSFTVPVLVDCQSEQANGLKTVTATYTSTIRPTSLVGGQLSIGVDASGNVVLTDGEESSETTVVGAVGGVGGTGEATGELLGATLSPGSALVETTVSTSWSSLSGSYTQSIVNPISRSFSFDYLAYTVTIVATGSVSVGRAKGATGSPLNIKGRLPSSLSSSTRETSRTYANSRGETRSEITSVGYYSY